MIEQKREFEKFYDTLTKDVYTFRVKNPNKSQFPLNREVMIRNPDDTPTGIVIPSPTEVWNGEQKKMVPTNYKWPGGVELKIRPDNKKNKHEILFLLNSPQNASLPLYKGQGKKNSQTYFYEDDKEKTALAVFSQMSAKTSVYDVLKSKVFKDGENGFEIISYNLLKAFANAFGVRMDDKKADSEMIVDLINMVEREPMRAKAVIESQETIPVYYVQILKDAGVLKMRNKIWDWRTSPRGEYKRLMAGKALIATMQDPTSGDNPAILLKLEQAYTAHTHLEIDLLRRDLNPDFSIKSEPVAEIE